MSERPRCDCGKPCKTNGYTVDGERKYRTICSQCAKKQDKQGTKHIRSITAYNSAQYKKDKCERCGFVPVIHQQLHVHHKDRNHSNNEESNLETLCSNCHILEHRYE